MEKHCRKPLLIKALIVLVGLCAATGSAAPPANDNWQNAAAVGNVSNLAFDTSNATFDGPGVPGLASRSPNIWYCYTAPCTGCATVSLCGSQYDSLVAVYQGCVEPNAISYMGYNDDFCDMQSQVSFGVVAGRKYLIEVTGYYGEKGPGVMTISCDTQLCGPPNDNCRNATRIGAVIALPFDTRCASLDGPRDFILSPDIWYRYRAPCTGTTTVSLCGSTYDTKLAVFHARACPPTTGDMIDGDDDYCGVSSQVTFSSIAGHEYLIQVGGFSYETGQGVLTVRCEGEPGAPANDNCADAAAVGNVTNMPFNTTLATSDGPGYCMTGPNLWYCYTATCTGTATVSLCGSSFDTMLAVYNGCGCTFTRSRLIDCNDNHCGNQSRVVFPAIAGRQYLIEVGGKGNAKGQGLLTIRCTGYAPKSDLGDAPDSTNNHGVGMYAYTHQGMLTVMVPANFPTVYSDGSAAGPYGPIHFNRSLVAHLGENISFEVEADKGFDQDGANNIDPPASKADQDGDDDGVIFPVNMPFCRWTTFDYLVNVIQPGTDLWVNAWCDWNRDGDWDDDANNYTAFRCGPGVVSEWAVQNQYLFNLTPGLHKITTPAFLSWHPKGGTEEMWMRITLSDKPYRGGSNPGTLGNGGSGPQAGYTLGETEDYFFVPDTLCDMCEDLNGDGVINIEDLITYIMDWLENCQ